MQGDAVWAGHALHHAAAGHPAETLHLPGGEGQVRLGERTSVVMLFCVCIISSLKTTERKSKT